MVCNLFLWYILTITLCCYFMVVSSVLAKIVSNHKTMNRKRNISYIKPEDPHFLKVLKKQVGYDDNNHKFDKLEHDFVDDEENELPQVVVLKKGDLTAEEAKQEKARIEKSECETKADLSQKVIFKTKTKQNSRSKEICKSTTKIYKNKQLLSFADEESESDT